MLIVHNELVSNIYVISSINHNNGPVKIGISDNPDKRVKQLQTAFPEKLEIKYIEPFTTKIKARTFEKYLHKDISHLKSHGEWFSITVQEAINYVKFTVINYDESTLL
jgi:hypothetical protein